MLISLLPKEYKKEARYEKALRIVVVMSGILDIALFVGIIFLLPSYFTLTFSQDEVARRLNVQQESLARQDAQALENNIRRINSLAASYQRNELRRKPLASLLLRLSAADTPTIALRSLRLYEDKGGAFVVSLQGDATTRSAFLAYVRNLEGIGGVTTVRSPVSNLLRETDVSFDLEAVLDKKFYSYAERP